MILIKSQSGKATTYYTEYTVDTVDDILELPVFPRIAKGSKAFCIENGNIYILDGNNKWKLIPRTTNGNSAGSGNGSDNFGSLTEDDFATNKDIEDWWGGLL